MRRLSIPLLAAVLLVTGCGGAPDSPVAEPSRSSKTSTAAPTSTALVVQLSSDQEQFAKDREACDAKLN